MQARTASKNVQVCTKWDQKGEIAHIFSHIPVIIKYDNENSFISLDEQKLVILNGFISFAVRIYVIRWAWIQCCALQYNLEIKWI